MSKSSKEYTQETIEMLIKATEKFDSADFTGETFILERAVRVLNNAIILSKRQQLYKDMGRKDPVKTAIEVYK